MNRETLLRFIRQIILTSTNGVQSILALQELAAILKRQGADQESLTLIESAVQGLTDSEPTMKSALSPQPALSPTILEIAVTRAHDQKLRDEEAARNSRC